MKKDKTSTEVSKEEYLCLEEASYGEHKMRLPTIQGKSISEIVQIVEPSNQKIEFLECLYHRGSLNVDHAKYGEQDVAIKCIKGDAHINQFLHYEGYLNAYIQNKYPEMSQYAVHFIAGRKNLLIFEYCSGGNLWMRLDPKNNLTMDHRVNYLAQASICVQFLHDRHILHRDLKADNFLIDSSGKLKIADFGFATVESDPTDAPFLYGAIRFQSPNVLQVINREKSLKKANQVDSSRPIFSREDEIYTFALMAYHILTSNAAYKEFKNLNTVHGFVTFFFSIVTAKLRPQFPPELNVPDKLARLITFGWNDDPQYRPKIADFVASASAPLTIE